MVLKKAAYRPVGMKGAKWVARYLWTVVNETVYQII